MPTIYSTKIRDDFYLNEQIIDPMADCEFKQRPPTHEVVIVDNSGSTMGFNRRMHQDIAARVSARAKRGGGLMSYGWFSGMGESDWIVKAADVRAQEAMILNAIEKHRPPFNLTCYVDILKKTEAMLDELGDGDYSLFFSTDGNDNQRTAEVMKILARLAPRFRVVRILGYGDYIDMDRLKKMALEMGGSFIHADDMDDFRNHFAGFEEAAENAAPKIRIPLRANPIDGIAYTLTNGSVEMLQDAVNLIQDRAPQVSSYPEMLVSEDTKSIFYFTSEPVGNLNIFTDPVADSFLPGLYGGARTLLQMNRAVDAIDVLGLIGDVDIVNRAFNAFTVAANGKVEEMLRQAIYADGYRFLKGRKPGCVPAPDAYCMFDLVADLMADPDVMIAIKHPAMRYKPKGRLDIVQPGYPAFKGMPNTLVPFRDIVFHESELNMSFSFTQKGFVELNADAPKYGFNQNFECKKWSSRSLVVDGNRYILRLPLANVSDTLLQKLQAQGLVESYVDGICVLDLTRIDIINRKIASAYTDLNALCDLLWATQLKEAENKVIGSLFKLLPETLQDRVKTLVAASPYTEEQIAYLKKFGINEQGQYAPPTDKAPATDIKIIPTITFGIKSFSSLPSLNDVKKKEAAIKAFDPNAAGPGKKPKKAPAYTPSEQIMADALATFDAEHGKKSEVERAVILRERRLSLGRELDKMRIDLHMARFAVTLGKMPFKQLPKLEEETPYPYNDQTFLIKVKEVEVAI